MESNDISEFRRPSTARFLTGNACILLATLFFGINIPVVKALVPEWLSAMDMTVWRLAGGCLLMWLASLFVHTTPIERCDRLKVVLGGALGIFSFIFLFNLSLRYGDPIDISIIMTLPPVFVYLYSMLFRKARGGVLEYAGLALGLAGAVLVIAMQREGSSSVATNRFLGDSLAVASALCYSFYLIIIEGPSRKYSPVSMLRWVFLFAFVPALFLVPSFVHAPLFHDISGAGSAWWMMAFVVVCPTFLSYLLLSPAARMIGSDMVSIYQYLVPVVATVGSVMMHLATLHTVQVCAMAAIIAGMVMTELGKRRRTKQALTK